MKIFPLSETDRIKAKSFITQRDELVAKLDKLHKAFDEMLESLANVNVGVTTGEKDFYGISDDGKYFFHQENNDIEEEQ